MYAKPQDIVARFTKREVGQLLEVRDGAEPDLDDIRIVTACKDAAGVADDYLRKVYPLPLAEIPDSLVGYTATIVRYKLHDDQKEGGDGGKSRMRLDYEDAIKWLQSVKDGDVSLFPEDDDNAPTIKPPHAVKATSRVAVVASPVVFTDETLGKMM